MKKSKVETERYSLNHNDLVTLLGLDNNQKITDIQIGARTSTAPWSLLVNVETTHTTEVPVPTFTEK